MYIKEKDLKDAIIQVAQERAVAVANKSINNDGLKVYEFEGKKYLLQSDVNKRLTANRETISKGIFTLLEGSINVPLAKTKIMQIHDHYDRTISFAKESVVKYANSLFDGL